MSLVCVGWNVLLWLTAILYAHIIDVRVTIFVKPSCQISLDFVEAVSFFFSYNGSFTQNIFVLSPISELRLAVLCQTIHWQWLLECTWITLLWGSVRLRILNFNCHIKCIFKGKWTKLFGLQQLSYESWGTGIWSIEIFLWWFKDLLRHIQCVTNRLAPYKTMLLANYGL